MADSLGLDEVTRLLVDPKVEVRQRGASAIAQRAAALFREQPGEEACRVLLAERDRIHHLYLAAVAAAYRRAGMIAVRALLSGLPTRTYPESVVRGYTALITGFVTDADPAVRLSTVEAIHELVRRFHEHVVRLCFTELFRALVCAVADTDRRVNALGLEVSLSVKEVVGGSPRCPVDPATFAAFVRDTLQPLAAEGSAQEGGALTAAAGGPAVASLVLDWTLFTLDIPGLDMVGSLPVMLPPLLRAASGAVTAATVGGGGASEMVAPVCGTAIRAVRTCQYELKKVLTRREQVSHLDDVLSTLLDFGSTGAVTPVATPVIQRLCLEWVHELLLLVQPRPQGDLARDTVESMYDRILLLVLPQLASANDAVRTVAEAVHEDLARALGESCEDGCGRDGSRASVAQRLVEAVCSFFTTAAPPPALLAGVVAEATCLGGLRWLSLLWRVHALAVAQWYGPVRDCTVALLCGPSVVVSHAAAEVLYTITEDKGNARLHEAVVIMLELAQEHAATVLPRLPSILKVLQAHMEEGPVDRPRGCERVLVTVAMVLSQMATAADTGGAGCVSDVRFVSKCVVAVNSVLLTSPEFANVRALLRAAPPSAYSNGAGMGESQEDSYKVFAKLCAGWQYGAVPMLSLCLLSGQYQLAFEVCGCLAATEASPATLVQLDRLAQTLESPVFAHQRLCLLRPREYSFLVQTLYAILMLLPQASPQYETLERRLSLIPGLASLQAPPQASGEASNCSHDRGAQWRSLLASFVAAQARVQAAEAAAAFRAD